MRTSKEGTEGIGEKIGGEPMRAPPLLHRDGCRGKADREVVTIVALRFKDMAEHRLIGIPLDRLC
jgi:hypothetical protein